jgi:hypothetical protein
MGASPIIQNWNWASGTSFEADSAQQIAVAQNADGRLEIFYIGTNDSLYHNWQVSPGGSWAGQTTLASDGARQVAVGQNADGRLEIFYVGTDYGLYHQWQTSPSGQINPTGWSGQVRFANDSASQVAVARNADGRLEIFYIGVLDSGPYHNWQVEPNGNWNGETIFGPDVATEIAVGRNRDGRLEIFYVGPEQGLYHNWQLTPGSPTWAGPTILPGAPTQQVAVGQNADGRLEVFCVGTNGDLYHIWQDIPDGNYVGQTRFPGATALQVAVGQNEDGRLEIFYFKDGNQLYHNWQVSPGGWWSGEFALSSERATQIAVGQNGDGRLELFYSDINNDLYHNWQIVPNAGWMNVVGPPVPPLDIPFGSNVNYILHQGCEPITDLCVTINVAQDIVCQSASGPKGFSFQLNCFSVDPNPIYSVDLSPTLTQQYVIALQVNQLWATVDTWDAAGNIVIPSNSPLGPSPFMDKIPAGYQLRILLQNDANANIIGVTFEVVDNVGNTWASLQQMIASLPQGSPSLPPIVAATVDLVGPYNSENAVLSSGDGAIIYEASSLLGADIQPPMCAKDGGTKETANSVYGVLTQGPSNFFAQSFWVGPADSPVIRRPGKNLSRPALPPNRQ